MLAWDRASGGLVEPSGIWKVFLFTDDAAASYDGAIATGATPVAPPKHLDQFRITDRAVEDRMHLIEIGQREDLTGLSAKRGATHRHVCRRTAREAEDVDVQP